MENQLYIALESNKLFLDIDLSELDLADIQGDLQPLKEGEILYREEDPADKIFLVVSGEINLLKKKLLGSTKSFIFSENDFFGYDEIAEETARTSTAVALRDSYLISLTKDELEQLLYQNHMIKTNLLNFSDIQPDVPGEKAEEPLDSLEEPQAPEEEKPPVKDKKTDVTSFEQSLKDDLIDKHDTSIEEDTSPYEDELKEDKFQKVHSEELPEDQVEQNIEETEHLAEEPLFTEDDDDEINIETEKDIKKDTEEEAETEETSTIDDETLKALESQDETPEEKSESKQKYNDFDEAFFSAFSEEEKQAEDEAKSQKDDADFDNSQEEDSFDEPDEEYTPHDAEEYISEDINEEEIIDDTKELDKLDEPEPEETEPEEQLDEDKLEVEDIETTPSTFESRLNAGSDSGLKTDQFKKIIKALQLVNSNIRIDEVLKNIVTVATDLTNADRGTLYLIDKENNELWSKIAMGSETKEIRLKMGEGIAGWVAQNRETVNIEDVSTDDRFKSDVDRSSGYETKSMLCFPIKDREDQIVGVLQLLNSKNGKFGDQDEEFLSAISIQCSLALQNAEMLEKFLQGERVSSLGKMTNFLIQDIKKPVLVSKRYAEHLKTKELNKDAGQIVEMILEQLTQVADLVQTTSSYAEGKSVLRTSRVSLNETLKEYSERLESYVKTRDVQIENQFADDAKVQLDSKEFFQCYNHIIRNACDAMPEGGLVRVSTKVDKDEVQIQIKDTGLGISEGMVDKIFEPFMTHGKKEGTGLGLTITKKIVESHSGKINVESTLGEGTTIIMSLPRSSAF